MVVIIRDGDSRIFILISLCLKNGIAIVENQRMNKTLLLVGSEILNVYFAVSCGQLVKQAVADESKLGQSIKSFVQKDMLGKITPRIPQIREISSDLSENPTHEIRFRRRISLKNATERTGPNGFIRVLLYFSTHIGTLLRYSTPWSLTSLPNST